MAAFAYLNIAAIVNLAVFLLIYFPIAVYCVRKVYQNRNEMFIQKRYSMITTSLCVFFVVFPLSTAFIVAVMVFATSTSILVPLSLSLSWISLWFLFYALICKYWIRYYCYKWTYFTLKQKWESIIVPNKHHRSQNWFLSHHSDYGNFRFVTKYIAFIYLLMLILSVLSTFIFHYKSSPFIGIIIAISSMELFAVIPIIVVVCKTYYKNSDYYFADTFCVGWESKQQLLSLVGMAACGGIATITMGIIGTQYLAHVIVSGTVLINGMCITIMCWCSTIKIIQKNTIYTYLEHSRDRTDLEKSHTPSPLALSRINSRSRVRSSVITLDNILQKKAAIKLFMNHLTTEFSVELLTSYIEFNQFQQYLMGTFHLEHSNLIQLKSLPSDLAVSSIVAREDTHIDGVEVSDDDILRCKYKAYNLYNKYIAMGSAHEINIAYAERDRLDALFFYNIWQEYKECNNIQHTDLLTLFENCKDEMIKLMKYSLTRFKFQNEEDYEVMCNIFSS
eukprot:148859_1